MEPYRVQEVKLSLVRSRRPTFETHRSSDVAQAFADLSREVRESLWGVYLNSANAVLCVERLSTGTMTESTAEPAEVMRTALLVGANGLILVHNHPSGSPRPSPNDRKITKAIAVAAQLFQIRLLDHVIIGHHGQYYSFADDQEPSLEPPV